MESRDSRFARFAIARLGIVSAAQPPCSPSPTIEVALT
jgi:hypothetical protein